MRKGHFCWRPALLLNQKAVRQISYINWPEMEYFKSFWAITILLLLQLHDVQNRIADEKMTIIL